MYLTSSSEDSEFIVKSNYFEGNSAMQGGAIKINDAAHLDINKNEFRKNLAKVISSSTSVSSRLAQKGIGGAVHF